MRGNHDQTFASLQLRKRSMTTAYIIEVDIAGKIYYATNTKGRLGTIPKFFNNAGRAKKILKGGAAGYGNAYFQPNHANSTRVIQIRDLERGLKGSFATIMSYEEFMKKDFGNKLRIPNNTNAIYMVQLPFEGLSTTPRYVTYTGTHGQKQKFGRQWQTAGHVRAYLSKWAGYIAKHGKFDGAKVIEIEMQLDGFTPKQVKSYPIVDFYCASPSCRVKYEKANGKYQPTPE